MVQWPAYHIIKIWVKALHMDYNRRILPFYMTYPGTSWMYPNQGDMIRDLEYFQQLYPSEVRRYQLRIAEILDRMDYEGSMIYDEYPDRYGLMRLSESMLEIIKREELEKNPNFIHSPERWEWLATLIFVLLNNEVYKRRHGGRRGFLNFS